MSQQKTTVKIYENTCTQSISIWDEGSGLSLMGWGDNTDVIQGYDDDGKEYVLPDGYRLGEIWGGLPAIFDDGDSHCEIIKHSSGSPQLVSGLGRPAPVLREVF